MISNHLIIEIDTVLNLEFCSVGLDSVSVGEEQVVSCNIWFGSGISFGAQAWRLPMMVATTLVRTMNVFLHVIICSDTTTRWKCACTVSIVTVSPCLIERDPVLHSIPEFPKTQLRVINKILPVNMFVLVRWM